MLSCSKFLVPGRLLFTSSRNYKVTVLGANSELGQTVSLLLRSEPRIKQLNIHDNTPSQVYDDLNKITSSSKLISYTGTAALLPATTEADIVLATGGFPKQVGVDMGTLAIANTPYIRSIADAIARSHPTPFVGIATEPINTMVPMVAEIMKCYGHYDSRKLFGLTGVHALRAKMMYAAINHVDIRECAVPIICGESCRTMVPLLSQAKPFRTMEMNKVRRFVAELRDADKLIMAANNGHPPVLSMAHSILKFTHAVMAALDCNGTPTIDALIENNDFGTEFFAGRVSIDLNGVREMERYPSITEFECDMLEKNIDKLRDEVTTGKRILETDSYSF